MKNNKFFSLYGPRSPLVSYCNPLRNPNSVQSYLGKALWIQDEFKSRLNTFYEYIGPAVLNPIDSEEAKKNIQVTQNEIEEHRNRYGTLSDQIANIQDQYEDRIDDAKAAENEVLKRFDQRTG